MCPYIGAAGLVPKVVPRSTGQSQPAHIPYRSCGHQLPELTHHSSHGLRHGPACLPVLRQLMPTGPDGTRLRGGNVVEACSVEDRSAWTPFWPAWSCARRLCRCRFHALLAVHGLRGFESCLGWLGRCCPSSAASSGLHGEVRAAREGLCRCCPHDPLVVQGGGRVGRGECLGTGF